MVTIYLTIVQHMKLRMQITQEHWEHDLTTNSVKFMQLLYCQKATVVLLSNTYCSTPTW